MRSFKGATRQVLIGFFGSHVIFTLLLDSQALLPKTLYPQWLLDLGQFEVDTFNDPVMGNASNLKWFQSLVCLELIFQLPYFFVALQYLFGSAQSYPDSFRAATIAYGAHTSTTLIPILTAFWDSNHDATTGERVMLTSLYFPYLLVPAWLLYYAIVNGPAHEGKNKQA